MSESYDYTPSDYGRRNDFADARRRYGSHARRSYNQAQEQQVEHIDNLPKQITTSSPWPLCVFVDVTGSMEAWPGVIFSKVPYLHHEVTTEYMSPETKISFGAIGDATCDVYPLQARPFSGSDATSAKRLEELIVEGNGGGQMSESYELAALYLCRNYKMSQAMQKPILIIIGDEMPYDVVTKEDARQKAHITLEKDRITTKEIFQELQQKFSVYLIRKPYEVSSGNQLSAEDKRIEKKWKTLIPEDRIFFLHQADRVVDLIFAILALETDKFPYFQEEIEGRQKPEQVAEVYKSIETVHAGLTNGQRRPQGASQLRDEEDDDGPDAESLI